MRKSVNHESHLLVAHNGFCEFFQKLLPLFLTPVFRLQDNTELFERSRKFISLFLMLVLVAVFMIDRFASLK
jgi:hypothetical protein